MVKIRKHLVADNIASRVTYSGINAKKYIVIHETANTRKGANANAHARLQASGNSRQASWHYTVDDKEIVQSFDDNKQCWHAGNRKYNEQSIGIEICVNEDGDFKKAVENAAELTKLLMDKYNIPISNVIQHYKASGKDCPHYLRSGEKGITWNDFLSMVQGVDIHKSKQQVKSETQTQKWTGQILRKGAKGPLVKSLQKLLISKGFNLPKYGADGYFGDETEEAVRTAQRVADIPVDGVAGPQTYRALINLKPGKFKFQHWNGSVIRNGEKGKHVKELQERLLALGYKLPRYGVDGVFGTETQKAVRQFQRDAGIKIDGIPGPQTKKALESA